MNTRPDSVNDDDAPVHHGEILLPPTRGDASPIVAAEINQQVATARAYPRRRDDIITKEISSRATVNEEVAAECMYSLPRGGKEITGPSIRFAELVFVSYGNLRAGARFVELDTKDHKRAAVIIEGVCLDLQSNVAQNIPVRRSIVGKSGMYGADMTNIAFAAGAAIARREAILKTVPKAIWGDAYKRVIRVLQGDSTTLAKRRDDIMAAFGRRDIKAERVLASIGVEVIEQVTIEHMPRLFGLLTALADGSETADSLFAMTPGGSGGERHNPLSDEEPHDPATGEVATGTPAQAQPGENRQNSPAQEQKPAAQMAAAAPPAAQTAPAATKGPEASAAQPAAAQQAAAGEAPATREGYMAYFRTWLASSTSAAAIKDRWGAERKVRTACGITGDDIEILQGERDAHVAELKAG